MSSLFSRDTLQIKIPASSPVLRGILYFLLTIPLVILAAEILARSPLGTLLPAPSIGADNFLLDAKIYQLERQVRRDGDLDCLFLGSSVSNSDIDPAVVERAYRQQTGETIHCYNLGLPALTVETAAALADAAIARFHPKVIIFAILPRDVQDTIANVDYLAGVDWVKYNRGAPSLNGWLVNHSHAWRYFLTWRYWLVTPNRAKMAEDTRHLTPKGFEPAEGFRKPYIPNLTMTPERLRESWDDPRERQAVENFLALQNKGIRIIFLEGPAYHAPDSSDAETWLAYQNEYLPTLLEILEANEVPFWNTDSIAVQIPKPQWYDWLHLNSEGALVFSQWLGETMAGNASLFK